MRPAPREGHGDRSRDAARHVGRTGPNAPRRRIPRRRRPGYGPRRAVHLRRGGPGGRPGGEPLPPARRGQGRQSGRAPVQQGRVRRVLPRPDEHRSRRRPAQHVLHGSRMHAHPRRMRGRRARHRTLSRRRRPRRVRPRRRDGRRRPRRLRGPEGRAALPARRGPSSAPRTWRRSCTRRGRPRPPRAS